MLELRRGARRRERARELDAPRSIWHDVECGAYDADLPLWRELAEQQGGPVLDVGAGTGRVALDLARRGHEVVALDVDAGLLDALRERAGDLPVETVAADARDFDLGGRRFALIVVPMQTAPAARRPRRPRGVPARRAPPPRARRRCSPPPSPTRSTGFDDEHTEQPRPDMREVDGVVFHSPGRRRRARRTTPPASSACARRVDRAGHRTSEPDAITLDRVDADEVAEEAAALGFEARAPRYVPQTEDYVGSEVVMPVPRAADLLALSGR